MKKIIIIFMTLLFSIYLIACTDVSSDDYINENSLSQNSFNDTQGSPSLPIQVVPQSKFSCNRAWVTLETNGNTKYGLVDTNGRVLKLFDKTQYTYAYDFENEFSYFYDYAANIAYIINKNGNQTSSFTIGSTIALGGGYTITEEDISGFDSTGYCYSIYDPNGQIAEQITRKTDCDPMYLGKGIFWFYQSGYYCANADIWVKPENYNITEPLRPSFNRDTEDAIIIGNFESAGQQKFIALYPDGTTKTAQLDLPTQWNDVWEPSNITDDVFVAKVSVRNLGEIYAAFNIKTATAYMLDQKYTKQAIGISAPTDGRILVSLSGEDEHTYCMMLDYEMNSVYGPVKADGGAWYSNSRLIVSTHQPTEYIVYDNQGNKIYSLTEKGYQSCHSFFNSKQEYACGILLVYPIKGNENTVAYLDMNGNPLEFYSEQQTDTNMIETEFNNKETRPAETQPIVTTPTETQYQESQQEELPETTAPTLAPKITWKEVKATYSYDSLDKLTGFLLQGIFVCDSSNKEGFSVENSFGGKHGHHPQYISGNGYEYMYFSFWIPNDANLEGWHSVTLKHGNTSEKVNFYLSYLGNYSHIVGTSNSAEGLGWTVTEWHIVS